MSNKATRLHPGVPLQVYLPVTVDVAVAAAVVDMVIAEVVVEARVVVGNVLAITELAI